MKAHDLRVALGILAAEHAALPHVAAKPHAPAVNLVCRRPVEDDAAREPVVMLQQEHHRLVKVLLPQSKAKLLPRAAENDRTLLDERRLEDEALRIRCRSAAVAAAARLLTLLCGHELRSEIAPVAEVLGLGLVHAAADVRPTSARAPLTQRRRRIQIRS